MFIPKTICIGFQNRVDTSTGKLAYIIYYDELGKIHKEKSWNDWRDEEIPSINLPNLPQSRFIINKGLDRSSRWGSGRSVIRIYDPRDFEFEISVDNLIGILTHSDILKREITEQCVFAWAGSELVLLPINSDVYHESLTFTAKQSNKVSTKSLIVGHDYAQKKNDSVLTYMGYRDLYKLENFDNFREKFRYFYENNFINFKKEIKHFCNGHKHVFYNGTKFVTPTVSTISHEIDNKVNSDYNKLIDKFYSLIISQPIVNLEIGEITNTRYDVFYKIISPTKIEFYQPDGFIYVSYKKSNRNFIGGIYNYNINLNNNITTFSFDSKLPSFDIDIEDKNIISYMKSKGFGSLILVLANGKKIPMV
jgi:hypothetical protein